MKENLRTTGLVLEYRARALWRYGPAEVVSAAGREVQFVERPSGG
jgi:hypothetical protein